jgi:hypothetical protein
VSKRLFILVAVLALCLPSSLALAAPSKKKEIYRDCAALNAVYPQGVARSKAVIRVNFTLVTGMQEPLVKPRVYRDNARLDPGQTGFLCLSPAVNTLAQSFSRFPRLRDWIVTQWAAQTVPWLYVQKAIDIKMRMESEGVGYLSLSDQRLRRSNICAQWNFSGFHRTNYVTLLTPKTRPPQPGEMEWLEANIDTMMSLVCADYGYAFDIIRG